MNIAVPCCIYYIIIAYTTIIIKFEDEKLFVVIFVPL